MKQEIRKRNIQRRETKSPSKEFISNIEKKNHKYLNYLILFGAILLSGGLIAYVTSPINAVPLDDVVLTPLTGEFALNDDLTHGTRLAI